MKTFVLKKHDANVSLHAFPENLNMLTGMLIVNFPVWCNERCNCVIEFYVCELKEEKCSSWAILIWEIALK